MPKLDLDQPDIELASSDAPSNVAVQWNYDGEERTNILHTKRTLEFGRESNCDVCLRVEPVEVEKNKEATLQISRRHFRLTASDYFVQITDLGSACGTSIDSIKLEPNQPFDLQNGEITVADVLQLSVRIEKENDKIQAVRLRRIDNLSGTEYVCLIGQCVIDIGENALLRLSLASARQSRSRALDIGQDHVAATPAMILAVNGGLHLKRTGNDPVMVNQKAINRNQSVPFPTNGVIQIGNSTFNVKTT